MILDDLTHIHHYASLHPRVARGLAWLGQAPAALKAGRHSLPDGIGHALVQNYTTTSATKRQFESHRSHIDVHYLRAGCELILLAPETDLKPTTPYHPTDDYTLFADPGRCSRVRLQGGKFLIIFPGEAHKAGCKLGPAGPVRKIVLKIQV